MKRKWIYVFILVLALIVLPTLTPEDVFTTFILVSVLGIGGYLLLALIVLLLVLLLLPKRYRKRLHF